MIDFINLGLYKLILKSLLQTSLRKRMGLYRYWDYKMYLVYETYLDLKSCVEKN